MCELIVPTPGHGELPIGEGSVLTLAQGAEVSWFDTKGHDVVFQCWHPETGEWSTMLPPVEGMAWKLSPGSKIRCISSMDAPAPAPSMAEQVEIHV